MARKQFCGSVTYSILIRFEEDYNISRVLSQSGRFVGVLMRTNAACEG